MYLPRPGKFKIYNITIFWWALANVRFPRTGFLELPRLHSISRQTLESPSRYTAEYPTTFCFSASNSLLISVTSASIFGSKENHKNYLTIVLPLQAIFYLFIKKNNEENRRFTLKNLNIEQIKNFLFWHYTLPCIIRILTL